MATTCEHEVIEPTFVLEPSVGGQPGRLHTVSAVICNSPGSLLVTVSIQGKLRRMWMCLPHMGKYMKEGFVVAPLPDASGKFIIAPGEVACAHTTNCTRPIGGEHGTFLVKEAMTGHHLIVCKFHHDLRTKAPRPVHGMLQAEITVRPLDVPGGPPPITTAGGE